jgi:hypothetical protein
MTMIAKTSSFKGTPTALLMKPQEEATKGLTQPQTYESGKYRLLVWREEGHSLADAQVFRFNFVALVVRGYVVAVAIHSERTVYTLVPGDNGPYFAVGDPAAKTPWTVNWVTKTPNGFKNTIIEDWDWENYQQVA